MWQYPVVRRPPWMLRPVKMLVSVTLRIDKWGVVVHRLGLCCTQVKLWAALLHSSGRDEVMTAGSCTQSRIPPHLCPKEELAALISCPKSWCAGSNFIFKVLVGSAGVWRWVLVIHTFQLCLLPDGLDNTFHVTQGLTWGTWSLCILELECF